MGDTNWSPLMIKLMTLNILLFKIFLHTLMRLNKSFQYHLQASLLNTFSNKLTTWVSLSVMQMKSYSQRQEQSSTVEVDIKKHLLLLLMLNFSWNLILHSFRKNSELTISKGVFMGHNRQSC